MATKHMSAAPGDFASTVIMPGDPLRARYIAENFLEDARQVTDVRNMLGFTGSRDGVELSIMAHGMGIPSASIYCTELIKDYGVKRILRAGSCGAVSQDIALRDILIASGASTDSVVNRIRFRGYDFAALADFDLVRIAVEVARGAGFPVHVGNVFSTDLFYSPDTEVFDAMEKLGILGVEMELAGIYGLAAEFGAQAMGMCTVSDHISRGEELSSDERATTFDQMIELVLETAVRAARELD